MSGCTEFIAALATRERRRTIALRRELHRHPELAFAEHATAAIVERELREAGLNPFRPVGTSVMASADAGRPGPVLVLRADMDALEITEATGLPYASENPGVMHACGHDGHVAALLAVARIVTAISDRLRGEIRFLFQHAEEPLPSGAPELIDAGVLDGASAVIAQHLWAPLPTGRVAVRPGPVMASTDYFEITVTGSGGHAGMPHALVDPVAIAAQVITNLQHIAARETDPLRQAVVSVTGADAGRRHNVIPETVTLYGTVRALDAEVRDSTLSRVDEIARGIAAAHRADAIVSYELGPPTVVNDARLTDIGQAAVRAQLGDEALADLEPVMAGEDFAWYQEHVPGVLLLVGAGGGEARPHHHPQFDIDEDALHTAVRVLLDIVCRVCGEGGAP